MIFIMSLRGLVGAGALSVLPALAQDYRCDNRSLQDRSLLTPAQMMLRGPLPAVFPDHARVVRVAPRIKQISAPQEECYTVVERVVSPPQSGRDQNIVGAFVGGLLGSQIGGGNGRAAATTIGAAGGALVGQNVAGTMRSAQVSPGPVDRQARRCSVVNRVIERNAGYDVSAIYDGHTCDTVLGGDPGPNLCVHVTVSAGLLELC